MTLSGGVTVPGVVEIPDDGSMLFGGGVPDVVRVPSILGGGVVRVTDSAVGSCPGCDEQARVLVLPDGLRVNYCETRREYLWWRRSADE